MAEIAQKTPVKEKKKKNKPEHKYSLKDMVKIIIDRSLNKKSKMPKIKSPFKVLFVEVDKNDVKSVVKILNELESVIQMGFTGYETEKTSNALASANKEKTVIIVLLNATIFENENITEGLKPKFEQEKIFNYTMYVVSPKSADLNLIYQFKKVE